MMWTIFVLLAIVSQCYTETSHRVHNIALYPEIQSWCKTTPIKQIVASPGYDPVTISNNVCVGACYSYSIPRTQPAEPGELIGPYCDSCQPSEIKCYHVNLNSGTKSIQKRVQIIMNCSCTTCDKFPKDDCNIFDKNTLELPTNLLTILNMTEKAGEDATKMHEFLLQNQFKINDVLNQKATSNINNIPLPEDVPDILEVPKPNKHKTEVDIKKLKQQFYERFQNKTHNSNQTLSVNEELELLEESLDNIEENNEKIEVDLKDLPESFGLVNNPHFKGQFATNQNAIHDDQVKPHHQKHHSEDSNSHHHAHHHLGEEQQLGMNLAHLVKGPHGSMVLAPDVEEKLHIDSDVLKPNNEGLVLSYENHHNHHPHHHHKTHHVDETID